MTADLVKAKPENCEDMKHIFFNIQLLYNTKVIVY